MARFDMGMEEIAGMIPASMLPVTSDRDVYFELGCMYAAGRSVSLDLVAAHKWFNLASSKGCPAAAGRRSELAAEMTAAEIAAAQRDARLWLARQ